MTEHGCGYCGHGEHKGARCFCECFWDLTAEAQTKLDIPRAKPLHATTADTQPNQFAPGGVWMVGCETCGWTAVGKYGGIILTEETALATAHARGTHHENRMNGKQAGT